MNETRSLRATSPTPDRTREALARLGEPEALAEAARAELGTRDERPTSPPAWSPPPEPGARRGRVRPLDVAAVVLLLIGGLVLPVVGWIVGVVLLWASDTWNWREKLLGTLVIPGGLAAPFALTFIGGQSCVSTEVSDPVSGLIERSEEVCQGFAFVPWIGVPVMLALLVAPALVAAFLLRRARQRAAEV